MTKTDKIEPKYSDDEVANFATEDKFMDASVELLKQTIELLWTIVGLKYCDADGIPKTINKDDAVIAGNLIRLIKLNTSFLQNICENKIEICCILNRCIAETAVNIKYMLVEGEERVKRNYIKNSLITEKELWETILTNIKEHSGDVTALETRMQNSIKNSFDNSEFDIDEVNRSSKWKSIKSRADLVGGEMFYSVYYGISSHSVHGNWQDILTNNLEKTDSGFKVNLNWNKARPQIIDGASILNTEIVGLFADKELNGTPVELTLKETCKTLMKYQKTLIDGHETWMSK